MGAVENRIYTIKEYLELEIELGQKLEYHDGQVYMMAGGTANHSIIATNMGRWLSSKLDETNCVVFNSDMSLAIEAVNRYVYPDLMVVCGSREYADNQQRRLLNPILIVEILSSTTESYDKTEKFRLYRQVPSFKEYVLVNPEKAAIDVFFKAQDDLWKINSILDLSDHVYLHSLGIELSMKNIYAKTEELKN